MHGPATLISCINFAYIMGWKNIVLVGVDLYDRRYFWLGQEETRYGDILRGSSHKDQHNTADRVIFFISRWVKILNKEGIKLCIYNPRSLLAPILDTYQPNIQAENLK